MVSMVSTIANGGTYIQPRIVKQIVNSQTGEVTNIDTVKKEQVISEETSKNMLSMMGTVVAEGTGKNAQVKGYSIGGKTGTSEDGVNTGKYVTSFVGVATVNNPEIAILITLYNPTGEGGHQGGGVAAPIASQVLGEVLPYLELKKDNQTEEEMQVKEEIEMPNVVGMNINDAKKALKEAGLEVNVQIENEENVEDKIVSEEIPGAGIKINQGTTVIIK